jgi:predicted transposase/invertase (TIGR01784 family)
MSKINPKIDLVFKKLFGTEKNIELLKSLVNSVLPEDEQVVELELKNPYNPSDYISGKISYLDIKAKDENDRLYDIEVQVAPYDFFGIRLLFYWSKLYASQLTSGQTYEDLRKTIVISLIDFNYFIDPEKEERHHRRIGLCDLETKEFYEQVDGIELHFVELKKFKKELPDIHSNLERWITFMNKAHEYTKDTLPKELATEELIKALAELEVMSFNEAEREHYENQEKKYLDKIALERQAKRDKEKQEQEIKEAKQKGELHKVFEVAKAFKKDGIPTDIIAKNTGLTKEQIDEL